MEENTISCLHINCNESKKQGGWHYCEYHQDRGAFGFGETYEQYQIIEQDFIDFIKVVPLDDPKHHSVHSPVLRDIILRTCSQIEILFKEWGLFFISEDENHELWKKYNETYKSGELKKEKNWNFGDYFAIKTHISEYNGIYVRHLNKVIKPFEQWVDKKTPPDWWNTYNAIKHHGLKSKKSANLHSALYALAALVQLHCSNSYSRSYLQEFTSHRITNFVNDVYAHFDEISTPIDSKRYLFKYGNDTSKKKVKLATSKHLELRLKT